MPIFAELRARYLDVGRTGSFGDTPPAIPISTQNKITPFIHGRRYFPALKAEIDRLGSGDTSGQFIYLMGWWFDNTFSLDKSANKLKDLLKAKARAGVDVRVMGWVMAPELLQDSRVQGTSDPNVGSMLALNNETTAFIQALRTEPNLADKAVLNILAHPAGAVHMKFALVGDNRKTVGFTGGIDLQSARHEDWWHDVAAKVEGPVVQSMFANFREQWTEIKGRSPVRLTIRGFRLGSGGTIVRNPPVTASSHTTTMPVLASRTLSLPAAGQYHVQSLTTVPKMNFSIAHSVLSMPTSQGLSFAPNGRFELRNAWIRAIQGASTYLYMEDQSFSSTELFDVIKDQIIKAQSTLKVILIIGGADPTAPGGTSTDFRIAINNHLLSGLNSAQRDRIGIFHRTDDILVHPKTTLIDDCWAMIGSANMMRRSLYTDLEQSVAFMDEDNNAGVIRYRQDLWGTHLGISPAALPEAIDAWFNIAIGSRLGKVERVRLPLSAASRSTQEQIIYDELTDPDSRQAWGGLDLVRLLMSSAAGGSGSGL